MAYRSPRGDVRSVWIDDVRVSGRPLGLLTGAFEVTDNEGLWSSSSLPVQPLRVLAWRTAPNASIEAGAGLMGDHLVRQGYRHIAYAGQTKPPGGLGLAGFRKGIEAAGGRLGYTLPIEGTGDVPLPLSRLYVAVPKRPTMMR